MPASDTECFQIFLETLAKKYPRQLILLFIDGAGNHHSDELEVPANIMLHFLPSYSRNSTRRKICGMRFGRKSSRTTLSNPWKTSTQSSKRPPSTSNAIRPSSNQSPL